MSRPVALLPLFELRDEKETFIFLFVLDHEIQHASSSASGKPSAGLWGLSEFDQRK